MGMGVKLTHWKTSCVRAEVVRHKKKLVSCHQKASVAEQSITVFNGDGGEHSHSEKRRVEGQSSEDTKKVSFMSQECKTSLRHAENK